MHVFSTATELRRYLNTVRRAGRPVHFVPTMGALHEGHLSLIEAARTDLWHLGGDFGQEPALTVCSIFVNPTQFNNPDDLARYPRTLEADLALLEAAGCDAVFAPSVAEMYPAPAVLKIHFGDLETVMEGAFRPGHFNGVGIVVAKLFHLVQPDRAYFGQKDLQQVAVVKRLVRDLSFPVEIVRCPTLREADGLAMSSRNRLLSPDERRQATELYRVLTRAQSLLTDETPMDATRAAVAQHFADLPQFRLEYFEIANADTLQPVGDLQAPGTTALLIAAQLGKVRLIDNLVF